MTAIPSSAAIILFAGVVVAGAGLLVAKLARATPFREARSSWRGLGAVTRSALVAAFVCGAAIGGSKTNSPPMRAVGAVVSSPGKAIRQVQEVEPPPFALAEVRTGGVNIAAPSTNAVVSQSLLRRGASEGGEWLELDEPVLLGTSSFTRVYASPAVLSFGSMRHPAQGAALPDGGGATSLVALRMPLGIAPEANWGRLSAPSRFWHGATPGGNIFTWENALLGRQDDAPATIQVETTPDGGFSCRYDFSQASPTNDFIIGAQFGAAAVEALAVRGGATNGATVFRVDDAPVPQGVAVASIFANSPRFELVWRNAAGLGDLSGDTDGDGLLDGDEIMLYGTDPRESDTDGDGMSDYAEVAQGLNPHSPDSDGDGVPDGWTAAAYAAHPLWATNAATPDITVRFAEGEAGARGVFLVDGTPFLLSGTNEIRIAISDHAMHGFTFTSSGEHAHTLDCSFRCPAPLRGGAVEDYGWFTDDPGGILTGAGKRRGSGRFAKTTLALHTGEEPFNCIHDDFCTVSVSMEPDIWSAVKDSAEIAGGTLQPNGTILVEGLDEPGEHRDVLVALDGPMFSFGVVGAETSVHRCESLVSGFCPICNTPHSPEAPCDHGEGCALATNGLHCTCDPAAIPLNADDDDDDGVEDRHGSGRALEENDVVAFGAGTVANMACCCQRFLYKVRFTSIPSSVRVWHGDSAVQAGAVIDGGMFHLEGVAETSAGQPDRIAYQILDAGEWPMASIDWCLAVNPSATVSFSAGDIYDGDAVVVKRPTDPVRTNNATCHIQAEGLADGRYRLHTDKGRFDYNGMQELFVELVDGECSAELYGYTPSATTNDATIALQSVEGTAFASTNYTVLWVEISMRCGQDEPFSADNDCTAFPTNRVLGKQITNNPGYEPSIGNVVEIIGLVHPNDFSGSIDFKRDNIAELTLALTTNNTIAYSHFLSTMERGQEPNCNDPCDIDFSDDSPSQYGHVYNIDTPGIPWYFLTAFPHGNIFLTRMNFVQYAVWGNKRCSDDFFWFTRTMVIRALQGNRYIFEFFNRANHANDNASGTGSTDITW